MKKLRLLTIVSVSAAVVVTAVIHLHGHNFQVLNPQGEIGHKERNLIIVASLMSLIVVIPVFVMLFGFAWKYREGNKKAAYKPDWDHSRTYETIWWVVPLILISILGVIAWNSSHELDPFKALASARQPIQVEVVALDWKWLFIYPQQQIATVNFLQFPVNTPVDYTITSDAPMNSFWIPSLGGQVYAMSGMTTQLHLMASKPGDYEGSSANISGSGFAGMKFIARASTQDNFDTWVKTIKAMDSPLNSAQYKQLSAPSTDNPVSYYSSVQSDLFNAILLKYMAPASTSSSNPTAAH